MSSFFRLLTLTALAAIFVPFFCGLWLSVAMFGSYTSILVATVFVLLLAYLLLLAYECVIIVPEGSFCVVVEARSRMFSQIAKTVESRIQCITRGLGFAFINPFTSYLLCATDGRVYFDVHTVNHVELSCLPLDMSCALVLQIEVALLHLEEAVRVHLRDARPEIGRSKVVIRSDMIRHLSIEHAKHFKSFGERMLGSKLKEHKISMESLEMNGLVIKAVIDSLVEEYAGSEFGHGHPAFDIQSVCLGPGLRAFTSPLCGTC